MSRPVPRWPRIRSLGQMLQSPAHRVVRVLLVTQAHWQVPEPRPRGQARDLSVGRMLLN